MKNFVIGLAVAMLVLHQDFWFWNDTSLVFGFIPMGLFYHALFSLAVAVLASLAIRFIWPKDLIEWATTSAEGDLKSNVKEGKYKVR